MNRNLRVLRLLVIAVVSLALLVPLTPVYAMDGLSRAQNPTLYDALVYFHPELTHDSGLIPQSELAGLTGTLNLYGAPGVAPITSLAYIGRCTGITGLDVSNNNITSLSNMSAPYGLGTMTNLTFLNLSDNRVSSLTPLSTLVNLHTLYFEHNNVVSLTPLSPLASLTVLNMANNFVNDLGPLSGKTSINQLNISWNLLNHDYPALYDNVIPTLSGLAGGQPVNDGQLAFDVRFNTGSNGTCTAGPMHGTAYNHIFTLPGVTVTNPAVTFIGWDATGDGMVDGGAGEPMDVSPAVPFAHDPAVHTFDFPVDAVYASTDASLNSIILNHGALDPVFAPATTTYNVTIEPQYQGIIIKPLANEPHATFTIAGQAEPNLWINVNPGQTRPVSIVVTAQAGNTYTRTYTVNVTRTAPQYGKLAGLNCSLGTLSPEFLPLTKKYTLTLPESVDRVTITPEKGYVSDTVRPLAQLVVIPKKGGTRTVTFTARSAINPSATTTYTVKVVRGKSSVADLSGIRTVPGGMIPGFTPAVTSYAVHIPWTRPAITLIPKAAEMDAKIWIDGKKTSSRIIKLAPGVSKDVPIRVVAPNGTSEKTYIVTIIRDPAPANASLAFIRVVPVGLIPGFDPAVAAYTVHIPWNRSSATVVPKAQEKTSRIWIDGKKTSSRAFNLAPGATKVVPVRVVAPNGTTEKTYTITLIRDLPL